tara:strand:+ start:1207 stop:1932 length:726 start_codon:yes stop_codon:yes gene_type:complete
MSVNYNFAFKNSKLKEWQRPLSSNLLSSEANLKSKIIYLYNILTNNPEIFAPPALIIVSALLIQAISLYPINIINSLESNHREYIRVSQKLSATKKRINTMKKYMDNVQGFFSQATPSYLFAFYLQNSVPQGVQLNNYFVSDTSFDITASAYEIEALNQLLTLLIESPVINKKSVIVENITRKESANTSNNGADSNVILQIKGNMLRLSLERREVLYKEAYAQGLLRKLSRFKNLNLLIRS